jgi:hypothetical protein
MEPEPKQDSVSEHCDDHFLHNAFSLCRRSRRPYRPFMRCLAAMSSQSTMRKFEEKGLTSRAQGVPGKKRTRIKWSANDQSLLMSAATMNNIL